MAWNEWTPPDRRHGFDFWYSYGTYDRHLTPIYWTTEAPRDGFHQVNQWGPEHETDIAIKYLKNENGKYREDGNPFALVISINPPHSPYNQVPQKYMDLYAHLDGKELANNRINLSRDNEKMYNFYKSNIVSYYSMITGVDEQVGRLLQVLESEGLADNTIFLFKSDHGCNLGVHGHLTKNNPYEESMRIPFIIRWPGNIKTGIDSILISVPDYYPTLIDLMGFGANIPEDIQGRSYAPIFRGEESVERPKSQKYYFIQYGERHEELLDWGARGVRTSRYTCVWDLPEPGSNMSIMLFDNINDPFQLQNIAEVRQDLVVQLKTELQNWLEYTGDPWIRHFRE